MSTVSDACSRYLVHLKANKTDHAANDAEARFNNYVLNNKKLAATELSKLTPAQLESWRKSLRELPTRSGGNRGGRRSTSTLNRDMTCFRAALNLAYSTDRLEPILLGEASYAPSRTLTNDESFTLTGRSASSSSKQHRPTLPRFCAGFASYHFGLGHWPNSRRAILTDGSRCSRSATTRAARTAALSCRT